MSTGEVRKADPSSRLLLEPEFFKIPQPLPFPALLWNPVLIANRGSIIWGPKASLSPAGEFSQVPCPRALVLLPSPALLSTSCFLEPLTHLSCLRPTHDTPREAAPTKEASNMDQSLLSTTVYPTPSTVRGISQVRHINWMNKGIQ